MKTKKDIEKTQEEIEQLRESLLEIITLMGPPWCAKVTGFNRSVFYNFKLDKKVYKSWSAERLIKTHSIFLEHLKNEENK